MAEAGGLGPLDEVGVDRLEAQAPVGAGRLDQPRDDRGERTTTTLVPRGSEE